MTNEELFRIERSLNDGVVRIDDVRALLYATRKAQGELETMATETEGYKSKLKANRSRHKIVLRILQSDIPVEVEQSEIGDGFEIEERE